MLGLDCGPGTDGLRFVRAGIHFTGVDPRRKTSMPPAPTGLMPRWRPAALPFADAAFSSVWAVDALAGLPPEEWDDAVRELRRVAEPGAPIAVVLPDPGPRSEGDHRGLHRPPLPRLTNYATCSVPVSAAKTATLSCEELSGRAGGGACPRLEAWLPSTHSPATPRLSTNPPSSPRRASVIGKATLAEDSSAFYGVSVRADTAAITVGAGTNLQDNVVLHADPGFPCTVGARVSIGHSAVVHGCTVEDDCLIGMSAS